MNKIILEDTRQKIDKNAHIKKQLEKLGFEVVRQMLYVGDYTYPTNQSICVDTKANMNEVESNLIHDHDRFKNECVRAKEAGIQLIILIQDSKLKSVNDVFGWWNPRIRYSPKAVNGNKLAKIMISMNEKYGVRWEFTTKAKCGKTIIKLLEGDKDE